MPQPSHFESFEAWWGSIGERSRIGLDEKTARISFVAGSRLAIKGNPQQYRFQCGRWKVTVTASSLPEAKAKAIDVLNRRAEKLLTAAPAGGWHLSLRRAGK